MIANEILVTLIGYLVGNFSPSYTFVRRLLHQDIRELGSGNAGTTNVNRVLGLKVALQVFALDMLKGMLAVAVGYWLAGYLGALLSGIAVVVGHNWPVALGFRGGKGMATTIGVLTILFPGVAALAVILFVLAVYLSRYISLGSILMCMALPLIASLLGQAPVAVLFTGVLAVMGVFQHRSNIGRLLKGTESRLVLTRSTNP